MGRTARLDGRVALVTGASRGIGRAIALRLAEEGADVAVNYEHNDVKAVQVSDYINKVERLDDLETLEAMVSAMTNMEQARNIGSMVESFGFHSVVEKADVSDYKSVLRMRDEIESQLGPVDILVNNAGIVRDKSFSKMTPEMWSDVISVNLTGTFNCTKVFSEGMLERGHGRIVNISSVVGRMGNRGQANYAASKAGVIGLTQTLAKEFANKGVTVNAIAPGFIDTDMVRSVPDKVMGKFLEQIPLHRLGRSEDIASAVAFLVSAEAGYITGQVLDVNGGLYI